jgi:4'-phosphopantetheinyl transferase
MTLMVPWKESLAVTVHYIEVSASDAQHTDALEAMLTQDEQRRAKRFVHAAHRTSYVAAHALRLWQAANFGGIALSGVGPFQADPRDVPGPLDQSILAGLSSSLSHTDGLVVCACAWGVAIGVDAEALGTGTDHTSVARQVLADTEYTELMAVPRPQRDRLFIRYWTLKEAVSKALKQGLALPFREIVCRLQPLRLITWPGAEGFTGEWHLAEYTLGRSHQMALAVALPRQRSIAVQWISLELSDIAASLSCKSGSAAGG